MSQLKPLARPRSNVGRYIWYCATLKEFKLAHIRKHALTKMYSTEPSFSTSYFLTGSIATLLRIPQIHCRFTTWFRWENFALKLNTKLLPCLIYTFLPYLSLKHNRGRDSAVGIATRYKLDDPGTETRWGQPSTPAQLPVQRFRGLLPMGKAVGTWHWPPNFI